MPIKRFAYVVDNMLADITHQIFLPKIEESAKDKERQNADTNKIQRLCILLCQYFIDNIFNDPRYDDITEAGKRHTDNGDSQFLLIGDDKTQKAFITLPTVVLLHGGVSPL